MLILSVKMKGLMRQRCESLNVWLLLILACQSEEPFFTHYGIPK